MAAHIDHEETLRAVERDGVVVRVERKARVSGLEDTDYTILFSALEEAGIPAAGAALPGAPNLVLRDRNPTVVAKGFVDVDLVYEHAAGPGQNFDSPHFGLLVAEVRASVNQVKTNKDSSGNTITVQHTYPPEDFDYPGLTKVQGGEIEYFQPQAVMTLRGIKSTAFPWFLARALMGAVNETDWAGYGPEEWMCTGVSWTPYDGSNSRYLFTLEFQHNPDTWSPTVVFIDERTGKPPTGLVAGTGYKTISKHRLVNFETVIGTRVQGG